MRHNQRWYSFIRKLSSEYFFPTSNCSIVGLVTRAFKALACLITEYLLTQNQVLTCNIHWECKHYFRVPLHIKYALLICCLNDCEFDFHSKTFLSIYTNFLSFLVKVEFLIKKNRKWVFCLLVKLFCNNSFYGSRYFKNGKFKSLKRTSHPFTKINA